MLRLVARHLGTLIPAAVLVAFVYASSESARGSFTWERPTLYLVAIISLIFGLIALVQLAFRPRREHPTVLMVTFVYEKATIALTFLATLFGASNRLFPTLPDVPGAIIYGLLAGTAVALVFNNLILYLGSRFGFYDEPCDPVPFRQPYRALRRRLAGKGR